MKDQINTIREALESDAPEKAHAALDALAQIEAAVGEPVADINVRPTESGGVRASVFWHKLPVGSWLLYRAAPVAQQYEAGDMASASAQGFRDGVASVAQQQQARPDFTDEWTGYLKDGETPFERFLRERKDLNALTKLYQRALEENERLKAQQPQAEAVAWLVCSVNSDGSLSLEHAAAWKEAAHEHISDAITEYGIEEAASWVVRPAYVATPVAQQPQADTCQMCGDKPHPGCNSEFQGDKACRFWPEPDSSYRDDNYWRGWNAAIRSQQPQADEATAAGLEASINILSQLVDEQRQLLAEVDAVFGVDEHGIVFEDGDSALIDRVRAHLAATSEAKQPKAESHKPLFADLIAQHPGLREELLEMDKQPQAEPDIHEAQGQIEFLDRKNNALLAAIRKVMARLADLLDEDQFKEIEETISSAGVQPQAEVGNSGFDHKTAADFLSGKTVSDEAVRKFVQASRWAHDDRASLQAMLLSVRNELASREAEIALLKKELMDAEAAPQQAEAVPKPTDTERAYLIGFADGKQAQQAGAVPRLTNEELRQVWYDDAPVIGGTYIDKLRQVETALIAKWSKAEAVPIDVVQVFPAPHKTIWGDGMVCVDVELSKDETATVYFDKSVLALAEKRFSFVAQQKGQSHE